MAAQQKVDYERIEPGWRAGILSPAQLAENYTRETGITVSRVAIIKHFEKLGVPRDLKAKIQAKADSMVAQAMVTGKVTTATTITTAKIKAKADSKVAKAAVSKTDSKTVLATENAVVEANALVSSAEVSVGVSSVAGVSTALVSAEVSALIAVETCQGFGGQSIFTDWLAKLRNTWMRAYAAMTKNLKKPVLADAGKQDEA